MHQAHASSNLLAREMNIGAYTAGLHFGLESLFLGIKQPATLTCNNICDIQSISKQVAPGRAHAFSCVCVCVCVHVRVRACV